MSPVFSARRLLLPAAVALLAAASTLPAQQLTTGDTLHLRLSSRVRRLHRAQPTVHAVVIAPVADAVGRVVVPPGSVLGGRVTGAGMERYGGKRHWLALDFDSLAVPVDDGTGDTVRIAIDLRMVAVDNARESTDSAGRIVGPPIPPLLRSKRDWAVVALGVLQPVVAAVLAATMEGEVAERHRKVSMEAGTELTAVVTEPTTLARWSEWKPPPAIASRAIPDSIATLAPLHAELREGHAPSDIIDIAVIGSAEQLRTAFQAAGWTRAVPMNFHNDFTTFVRAVKGEGYDAQPVSELALGGRPPIDVYEKVADTFLKRHHFRVWRWPVDADADDRTALWLIAATDDTGLMFSAQRHAFTHTVDPRIDLERDKIVSDLVAADHVAAMSYATRPAPEGGANVNGGRAKVITDWRLAVLVLK